MNVVAVYTEDEAYSAAGIAGGKSIWRLKLFTQMTVHVNHTKIIPHNYSQLFCHSELILDHLVKIPIWWLSPCNEAINAKMKSYTDSQTFIICDDLQLSQGYTSVNFWNPWIWIQEHFSNFSTIRNMTFMFVWLWSLKKLFTYLNQISYLIWGRKSPSGAHRRSGIFLSMM